ncbi:MAG: DUF1573 domain-containing protein [Pirellulales bacterium]|nr:DUF1573 domain-containing protein [Pirellulales bacterium]
MRSLFVLVGVALVGTGSGIAWGYLQQRVALGPSRLPIERMLAGGSTSSGVHGDTAATPKIEVVESVFDFGVMDSREKGEHEFTIRNVGQAVLLLHEAGTSCRCALGELKKRALYPGESTKLTLTWTAAEYFGPFEQTARLDTTDPAQPVVTLKVKGRITSPLRAAPPELVFTRLSVDQAAQGETCLFAYSAKDLQAEGFELLDKDTAAFFEVGFFPLEKEQIAAEPDAQSGVRVEVAVKPGLPQGTFEQTIRVKTNLAAAPTVDIVVKGRVGSDISVLGRGWNERKALIDLGLIDGAEGARQQFRLVVRGPYRREVAFEILDVHPRGLLEAELGKPTEINQGVAVQTPLLVRVIEGGKSANYLGAKQGDIGYILLGATHPHVRELKIPVRFAVKGT